MFGGLGDLAEKAGGAAKKAASGAKKASKGLQKRAAKKGISTDELKHNRKENFKTGLANLAGGRGAWTQKNEFGSKPGAPVTQQEAKDMAVEKDTKAIKAGVTPSSGGGADTTQSSPDRSNMQDNASGTTGRSGRNRSYFGGTFLG